ncbi:VCBS domain-containing protein, partial [Aureimonas psammosilenae]|uniref:VCBS domain-containing protein n=1 Tax=Aureimonas psammosilenae TaxID=2495496 RepID=UPI0022A70FB8
MQGDAARTFANTLSAATGAPVAIIDGSVGGTPLLKRFNNAGGDWESTGPDSLYGLFKSKLDSVGGRAELMVWIQGESDAGRGGENLEYYAALKGLFTRIEGEIAPKSILMSTLGSTIYGNDNWNPYFSPEQWQKIFDAQTKVASEFANVVSIATTDLDIEDNIHRSMVSASTEAVRLVDAYLSSLGQNGALSKLVGTSDADVLNGTAASDFIEARDGDDVILGGAGNDILRGEGGADRIEGGDGIDLLSGGAGNDVIDGGAGRDRVTGDDGNDELHGGDGDDIVYGGEGEDVLHGDAGDDILVGGNGDDRAHGGDGNDQIYLGSGNDRVYGDDGNDTFIVDNVRTYMFAGSPYGYSAIDGGNGDDTIRVRNSGMTLGLESIQNIETITANGFNNFNIEGSASSQELDFRGVQLIGVLGIYAGAGDDVVYGSVSADRISGDDGDDKLFGWFGDDVLSGGSGNDSLSGQDGNDTLIGGDGNDLLSGGDGYDTAAFAGAFSSYVVDRQNGTVSNGAGDVDSLTGIERLTFSDGVYDWQTGVFTAAVTGVTIRGTVNNDVMSAVKNVDGQPLATFHSDTLFGFAGNDTLDGGAGADRMVGGTGDDTYTIDDAGDVVVEAVGEGVDTVNASVAFVLADNVERLTLTGSAAIDGTGNALANRLIGNAASNVLIGLAGNDTLDGGGGADRMIGGTGDDTYTVDNAGDVVVEAANEGTDTVNSWVTTALAENVENLILIGASAIDGTGNALANRLAGNAADNVLIGLAGNDILDGGAGADRMVGGVGDDTYTVDNAGDVILEVANEGYDTVNSSVSLTLAENIERLTLTGSAALDGTGNAIANRLVGNAAANILIGLAGNDTLDGGAGADRMVGGTGDDTYTVDNAGDVTEELANEGTDSVNSSISLTLSENIENLTLIGTAAIDGTGNALANRLTGNAANNVLTGLAGNDTLDGGAGADRMVGGTGDDTYSVDNAGDLVVEAFNEGYDTVNSSITLTLAENVERLTLTGSAAIDGTGNALANRLTGNAADNVLTGLAGNDTLDGGAGADRMVGGTGDDTYSVDNAGDLVVEAANEGTDTVNSSITLALADNVENLTLTGTAAIDGTGNALANKLVGNSAGNILNGGKGDDTLDGGGGVDTAIYEGNFAQYAINRARGTVTSTAEGSDRLSNIEFLKFKDGLFNWADGTFTRANTPPKLTAGVQSADLVEATAGSAGVDRATIALAASDVDTGDVLSFEAAGWTSDGAGHLTKAGLYGTAKLDLATGVVSYALDNASAATDALTGGQRVVDAFEVGVRDGSGALATTRFGFAVVGADDAPVVTGAATALVEGDEAASLAASGTVTITDADGVAEFAAQSDTQGLYGRFTLDASGQWRYAANGAHDEFAAGVVYTDSFTVRSADGSGSASVVITITGTNDAPKLVASVQSADLVEATAGSAGVDRATIALTASDADTGDVLSFEAAGWVADGAGHLVKAGLYGTAKLDVASGVVSYALDDALAATDALAGGQRVVDAFEVGVRDGSGALATTRFGFAVVGADDAPVVTGAATALVEGDDAASLAASGTVTITDADGVAEFAAQSDTQGLYGRFTLDASGQWRYAASGAHDEFA